MDIWAYVNKHTFSSPQRHIALLIKDLKSLSSSGSTKKKVLDIGGGLVNRKELFRTLGKITTLDLVPGKWVDVVGDAHKLPFPDRSFDYVTLFMVLEHLHSPLLALRECNRVLKKKGIILLTTVQYWHTHSHPNDYYRYTKPGLEYLLENSDFNIIKMRSQGGPFLVVFHSIELNLPVLFRKLFLLTCPIFNYLDLKLFNHEDTRHEYDSVGWSLIAIKK